MTTRHLAGDRIGLALLLSAGIGLSSHGSDCVGDLDGSGTVDGGDLTALLGGWGACEGCPGDLDSDGRIDGGDLTALLGAWGPCPDDEGDGPFNYEEALQKALTFYAAQQAGDLPEDLSERCDGSGWVRGLRPIRWASPSHPREPNAERTASHFLTSSIRLEIRAFVAQSVEGRVEIGRAHV